MTDETKNQITVEEAEMEIQFTYEAICDRMPKRIVNKLNLAADLAIKQTENIFICEECGRCCNERCGIQLNNVDIRRLSDALNITKEQFCDKYVTVVEKIPHMAVNSRCEFLSEDNHCTVYGSRPKVCKEYPCRCGLYKKTIFVAVYNHMYRRETVQPIVCSFFIKNKDAITKIIFDAFDDVRRN